MASQDPREIVIGLLRIVKGYNQDTIESLFNGDRYGPKPLTDSELEKLQRTDTSLAPLYVQGNIQEWVYNELEKTFSAEALKDEVLALNERAPLDIRVNLRHMSRDALRDALHPIVFEPCQHSSVGLRYWSKNKALSLHVNEHYLKGHFEIQDEGSQLIVQLLDLKEDMSILDLCSGAGGKALAIADRMGEQVQLVATDVCQHRLSPIFERMKRSQSTFQVVSPKKQNDVSSLMHSLSDLRGKIDCVLIDSPCSGSGTWRRHPDTKWKLTKKRLDALIEQQTQLINLADSFVNKEGKLVYVTCSMLSVENDEVVHAFLAKHRGNYIPIDYDALFERQGFNLDDSFTRTRYGIQLSSYKTGTDGYYFSCLQRVQLS